MNEANVIRISLDSPEGSYGWKTSKAHTLTVKQEVLLAKIFEETILKKKAVVFEESSSEGPLKEKNGRDGSKIKSL